MSEETAPQTERPFYVLVLLLVTTVFAAVVTALQTDASIRASQANIQSQYDAVLVSAELFRQGQQSAYDIATLSTYTRYQQETTVLEYSALQLENQGNPDGAAGLRQQASSITARAEAVKNISIFYADPRYIPSGTDQSPDVQAYMSDQVLAAKALVVRQNAASDDFHRWDDKASSYLTVLTILALVFFLLGIAQNARKLRVFFTLSALVILLACGVGTLLTLIS